MNITTGGLRYVGRVRHDRYNQVLYVWHNDTVRDSDACPVKISGAELPKVTVSIGMTKLRPGDSLETMLASADGALYHAGNAGRDCARIMPGR